MRGKVLVGVAAVVAALWVGAAHAGADGGGSPPPFLCNKTVSGGTINSNVSVPAGAVCILNGVTVNGSVSAGSNAYFESNGSKISGSVLGNQALTLYAWNHSAIGGVLAGYKTSQLFLYDSSVAQDVGAANSVAPGYGHFQICGSTLGGNLGVAYMGPDILIGDPAAGCGSNSIKHDVFASYNGADGEVYVIGNTVLQGDMFVSNNTGVGDKRVQNNTVSGDLNCSGNSSPFTASGNTAHGGTCN